MAENSKLCQGILQQNGRLFVIWNKSTREWLKQKESCILEWPSQAPDLNPTEAIKYNLEQGVQARHPENIYELKDECRPNIYT